MVSSFILGLLLTAAFMIYRMGASAWLKSDAKSELLQIAQVVTAKVNREVESSNFRSLSVAPDGSGVAFLSAKNANGVFVYDPVSIVPRWQKYIVLYFQSSDKTLYRREISVVGQPQEMGAAPIESRGAGAVETYFSSGQVVAHGMDVCRFSTTADEQLVMELELSKKRYGSEEPERQFTRIVTAFRN